eukprot:7988865-Prorocentrum_lima.AAC.1
MTSSLVGSEMCIRDSPTSTQSVWHRPTLPGQRLQLNMHPPVLHHSTPVSYTHLTLPTICSV